LKREEFRRKKIIKVFDEDKNVQVLNGRFGPYIAINGKNIKVPKDTDPASLTLPEIYELEKNAPEPKRWGRRNFGKSAFGTGNNQRKEPAPLKKAAAKKKPPVTKSVQQQKKLLRKNNIAMCKFERVPMYKLCGLTCSLLYRLISIRQDGFIV